MNGDSFFMSSTNDIANSHGRAWTHTQAQPVRSTTASTTGTDFGNVFGTSFQTRLTKIVERGLSGEFDTTASGAPDSLSDADTSHVGQALEQRGAVLGQRVTESLARLSALESKLNAECEDAKALPPTWEGSWDPKTYRPKSEAEAEQFAQRMAVDTATAAAAFDVLKTQLDAAQLEASTIGGPRANLEVASLTAKLTAQTVYLADLAAIVDRVTDGSLEEIGEGVVAGISVRALGDLAGSEIAKELSKRGLDADQIETMLGAGEIAYEDATNPQSHQTVTLATTFKAGLAEYYRDLDRNAERRREVARKDDQEQRLVEKRTAKIRRERELAAERVEERRETEQQLAVRRADRHAQDQRYVQALAAAAYERRRLAHA